MKHIFILFIVSLITHYTGIGQITSKGTPLFYHLSNKGEVPVLILPDINLRKLEKEDKKNSKSRSKVFRYAQIIETDINPEFNGIWHTFPNGDRVWYIKIKSPKAYSLSLLFDKYRLPPDATLFVYSADKKHIRGAFTYKNNKSNNILALSPVAGDEVIIEYFEPANVLFKGELHISSIAHDYKNVFNFLSKDTKGYGSSGSCNININCDNSDLWQLLKHSVCKITYNGLGCSGALINNTKQDGYPYLLTANHCLNNSFDASSAIFYFNYESPTCINIDGPIDQTISGSTIVATPEDLTLDFSLLELSVKPPPSYHPYYAGWNRDFVNPVSVTSIHHPMGDIKKISKSFDGATTNDFGEGYNEFTHWWIDSWDEGTTEKGSSGSPLFNSKGEIIGDLSGGDANCNYNYNDYYQQFYHSWDYFSESNKKLEPWLDPVNSNVKALEGYLPYDTVPSNLRAFLIDTTINLKWNITVDNGDIEYYYIYRDSVKFDSIVTAQFSDTLAYTDTVYTYWITAKYNTPVNYETSASNSIFIRIMDSLALPFGEDFESQFSLPPDWYEERTVDTIGWEFKTGGFPGIIDTAYEGSVNAYYKNNFGESSKLVLPRFDLSLHSHALLSFYMNMQALNTDVHNLNVLYKDTDSTNWKVIKNYSTYFPEWEKQKVPLPNLSDNYQIAFEGIGLGGFGISLDSILLVEDNNYVDPVFSINKDAICLYDSVLYSTILDNSYNLKWDFGSTAIPDTISGAGPHWVKYKSSGIKSFSLTVNNTYTKNISNTIVVYPSINASFTNNSNILVSNALYGNQWYLNGEPIAGATDTLYTIEEDGSYFVEVTNNFNCISVSESQYLVISGIEDIIIDKDINANKDKIQVFPNPNSGNFKVKFNIDLNNTKYNYKIIDINGKVIKTGIIDNSFAKDIDIELSNPNEGLYFIHFYSSKNYFTRKILIKK